MADQNSRRQFMIASSGLIVAVGCGKEDTTTGPEPTEPIGDPDYYPNTSRMPSMPMDNSPSMPMCSSTAGLTAGPMASALAVNQSMQISGNLFIGRDANGLFALSTVCQHAGCGYPSMKIDPSSNDWICACHGSRYGFDGTLKGGPALRGLPRYYVCKGSDGRLYIDTTRMI